MDGTIIPGNTGHIVRGYRKAPHLCNDFALSIYLSMMESPTAVMVTCQETQNMQLDQLDETAISSLKIAIVPISPHRVNYR